jgi:predicted O-methyltransferase YrrM
MTATTRKKAMLTREQKNHKYRHTSLEMETSTHFPLLMKLVQATEGTILELGSGMFSTPLLHWMCFESQRKLVTWERHLHYLEFASKFKTPWHEVVHIPKVENVDIKEHYSIVFIDHSPKKPRTRGDDALLFKDKADFVILHDAGVDGKAKYGYEQLYSQFKFRYDWTGCLPHTTVLSNVRDPAELWS